MREESRKPRAALGGALTAPRRRWPAGASEFRGVAPSGQGFRLRSVPLNCPPCADSQRRWVVQADAW